ncbi:MAG: tyrosine-type recombinase/integrase [Opitutales bacterium]|nr:tyrosine-type recombinase/integrase [Opitutales bacterium]NRA28125.1 tyrosine-type recombinase/integrase [Opitutales bacterium]
MWLIITMLTTQLYHSEQERILVEITRHMPVLPTPCPLPRDILNKDEVTRLLQQADLSTLEGFRDRTALEILYSSGLLGEELCKLTVYDLDMKERTIRLVQGKGRKDRLVPLGNVAGRYLEAYLTDVYPKLQKKEKASRMTLFLIHPASLRERFKNLCLAAGLPDTLSTHCLHHACATELLRGEASIRHVQELLGHGCITTTQICTHIVIDDLHKAHKKTGPNEQRTAQSFIPFNRQTAAWRQEKPRKKPRKQN